MYATPSFFCGGGECRCSHLPTQGVGETNYDIDWAGGVGLGSGGVVVLVMVVLVLVVGLCLVGLRTFVFC